MADSITSRVLFNVFKVSFLIISLTLFSISWFLASDLIRRDNWPTIKGKVFYSQVVEKYDVMFGRKVKHYDLDIKYGYVVNKVRYDKKGLFLGKSEMTLERSYFEQKAKEFKRGDIVKVHYNPQNPKEAYLVADVASGSRTFYNATKKMVYFAIFLFLITPFISLFKDRRFVKKNTVNQGLVVPDDARRVQPIRKHR